MSQFMQIDIRVIPFFEVPFEKRFPHLAELFGQLRHGEVLKKEPSFYELIDTIETISEHPNTPKDVREQVGPYVRKMAQLKEKAREDLLGRRLDDLDRLLYQIEDQFEDLEGVL